HAYHVLIFVEKYYCRLPAFQFLPTKLHEKNYNWPKKKKETFGLTLQHICLLGSTGMLMAIRDKTIGGGGGPFSF
ncbi:hypothetical protein ACJX0J_022161, partial [Zea mays]